MKKYGLYLLAIVLLTACDPTEDRNKLSSYYSVTMADIDKYVSVEQEIIDGKRSNYVNLNSDGLPGLSRWDYVVGLYPGTKYRAQLVLENDNEIVFTAISGDGSTLSKSFTVNVEELFDVPSEWGYLCGTGEKEWIWDTDVDNPWGNGGYLGNTSPGWWQVSHADLADQADDAKGFEGEGSGASMIFKLRGRSFEKHTTNNEVRTGTFAFDMSEDKQTLTDDGSVWATGKLTINNTSVLMGYKPNNEKESIKDFDILYLDDEKMVLAWPEPGAGAWGTAWFWMFKAK